ncbi:hypothetical protein [Sanguibacter suaedae]|uniref:Zinc-ribbon 15 domain-containing protein n=1 Tax=Sanguibacter suaedae TaxID=2795737 RepID=A0A934I8F3_9MICO|nr:hypothetical protein [Sanguibacter suaedae]MBI9113887.1 hypothetical protein [Sanguibacter suaedae]
MIFFFGTRRRRSAIGAGTFSCPFCLEPREYEHARTRTWAHVFWIPVFPLGSGQESVRCTVCGGEWAPAVLGAAQNR